jgi:hypothetical protein
MRVVSLAASNFGVIDHIGTMHCTIVCCRVRPTCMIVCSISPLTQAPSDAQFNKVQNAAPDLSAVNEPLTDSTGLPNPFDKGSGGIPRASDITELAARAKKEVRRMLGSGCLKADAWFWQRPTCPRSTTLFASSLRAVATGTGGISEAVLLCNSAPRRGHV